MHLIALLNRFLQCNPIVFRINAIGLLCAFLAATSSVAAQEQGPVSVSSNGVTISFQSAGGSTVMSNGATISFQNAGGSSVSSNGATISFQNAGSVGAGSSGVTIGFGNPLNPSSLFGHSPHSGFNADPVNTATGNYIFERTDLTIPGRGLSFEFKRLYNSQDPTDLSIGLRLDAFIQRGSHPLRNHSFD